MAVKYSERAVLMWNERTERWTVWQAFTATWSRPGRTIVASVPSGFITDLASVPRPLWWLLPPQGAYLQAAVTHDWCYEDGVFGLTRSDADKMFLDGMKSLGVPMWKRWAMYAAVRVAAGPYWGKSR